VYSTCIKAWQQVLAEAETQAECHTVIGEKLDTDIRKTMKYQAQENEKKLKEVIYIFSWEMNIRWC
jgi:hypothetical protein